MYCSSVLCECEVSKHLLLLVPSYSQSHGLNPGHACQGHRYVSIHPDNYFNECDMLFDLSNDQNPLGEIKTIRILVL